MPRKEKEAFQREREREILYLSLEKTQLIPVGKKRKASRCRLRILLSKNSRVNVGIYHKAYLLAIV